MIRVMKVFRYLIITCIVVSGMAMHAQRASIRLAPGYAARMLDHSMDLRKTNYLYKALRADTALWDRGLILSGSLIAIADYQYSTHPSKFGYLMRHPTSSNQVGQYVSEALIHHAKLAFTYRANAWMTSFVELLYHPLQSFGRGTITSLERNRLELRRGFVLLGNPEYLPVFLAIGKLDVPFGLTGSVNNFTNSTAWHAFGGLAYGAQVAFHTRHLTAQIMWIQGGAQFRAANTPVEGTDVPSRVNNFALDAHYTWAIDAATELQVGASYLHGSAYCQDFPVEHFKPCSKNNPAWSTYGQLELAQIAFKLAYFSTFDVWPGTHNPNPPLDIYPAAKVESTSVGLRYHWQNTFNWEMAVYAEYSDFVAGAPGAPWERQSQTILGMSATSPDFQVLFAELFQTVGYVPLNFLSGGNFEDPGVTHSVRDARTLGIVVGYNVFF